MDIVLFHFSLPTQLYLENATVIAISDISKWASLGEMISAVHKNLLFKVL